MIIHNGENWYYSRKGLVIFGLLFIALYLLGYLLENSIIVGVIFAIVMSGIPNYFILRKQFKESMSIGLIDKENPKFKDLVSYNGELGAVVFMSIMIVIPIWIYSLYKNIKQRK